MVTSIPTNTDSLEREPSGHPRLRSFFLPPCLHLKQYKLLIKGKVEQSRERSSALPYTLV